MALCPNCMGDWLWDWCQDAYRYPNGEFVETGTHVTENGEEMTLFICKCGSVNSTMALVNEETLMTYVKPWKDIDWEQEQNCWTF